MRHSILHKTEDKLNIPEPSTNKTMSQCEKKPKICTNYFTHNTIDIASNDMPITAYALLDSGLQFNIITNWLKNLKLITKSDNCLNS